MHSSEGTKFRDMIMANAELYRHRMTPGQLNIWWNDLKDFDYSLIERAFEIARQSGGQFMPTTGAIRAMLPDPLGHPTPEEAWNRLPKSEHEAGYVTSQMMQAFGACRDSIERGDIVGARMAFLEAYKRFVSEARVLGQRANFFYSGATGGEFEQRRQLQEKQTLEAAERGWLSRDQAQQILIGIAHDLRKDEKATVQRLEGSQQTAKRLTGSGSPEIANRLKSISASLSLKHSGPKRSDEDHIRELIEGGA